MRKVLVLLTVPLVALAAAFAATAAAPERKVAPEFALRDQTGKLHELKKLRGKVVVLDFGRVICLGCQQALADLGQLDREFRDKGLVVLSVNLGVPADVVKRFAAEKKLEFPFLEDPGYEVTRLYGVRSIPHIVLIDRKGRAARAFTGYDAETKQALAAEIRKLLAEK